MPRYILVPSHSPTPKHTKLVKKLVEELTGEQIGVQPVILETQMPATKSRHVQVIWDEWEDISDEQRSSIILEAYTQLEGEEAADQITIAEGLTPQEALGLGLLPFKIASARTRDERISPEDYRKAFLGEAKKTVLGSKAKELRYARLDEAKEAMRRLTESLPGSHWSVVEEVMSES